MSRALVTVGLSAVFIAHLALIIGALCASPARFDSSSEYLFFHGLGSGASPSNLASLASRLMAWDDVIFMAMAKRGVQYEHELAFSQTWTRFVRLVAPRDDLISLTLTASGLAVLSHFAAMFVLVSITRGRKESVLAGVLYALSPAGVFLVSGYMEASFALLSFVGLNLFRRRRHILAGALFALSVLLRANGLFWGLLYADALMRALSRRQVRGAVAAIVGGSLIGLAFALPQYRAYLDLCTTGTAAARQPWCDSHIPLVYTYVQEHYWNNGFLRYWTLSQVPNFLLAAPTLILLVQSSRMLLHEREWSLAAVHIVLLIGAIFFWHVQIVTRVASGLPGPYWYVAKLLASQKTKKYGKAWLAYFILWGLIQACLFGAFLPPA